MTVNIIKQRGFLFKRIESNKKPPVKYEEYRDRLNLKNIHHIINDTCTNKSEII